MKKFIRFTIAFITAPLAAPLVMYVFVLVDVQNKEQLFSSWNLTVSDFSDLSEGFKIVLLAGSIVSYTFAVLLGLPLYWLFNRKGLINYWSLSIGSALIASLPLVLMNTSEGIHKFQENISIYLILAVCGFVVGTVFYLINNRKTPNNCLPLGK